ncbi:hypothetical protein B0A55_07234 [Friedmanniomyces simplex]|uniref:carnosine N-methyltransferase n=1 Tax=Friedmanniomyces simplex TaxID=329884 RepID=A0A4U0X3W2_9PEZI|nr:hypothetical protein B0A55_07234 [Friedmanniomyces simplex]
MADGSTASSTDTGIQASPLDDPEERRVLHAALDSFQQYRQAAHYNITHLRRQSFYSLPSAHMEILCEPPFSLPQTFDAVDAAIDSNADISEAILATGLSMFGAYVDEEAWKGKATPTDLDKARSTIRQLYRDWSCEDPWALNFNNHLSRANQLQSVKIPDVHPHAALAQNLEGFQPEIPPSDRMNMTAGDFCELYLESRYRSAFDAVTTCFFIDTASNVIDYIETVKHTLRSGGIWINLGPLLWHFEATPTPADTERQSSNSGSAPQTATSGTRRSAGFREPGSFELSNDEVVALVERFGFDVIEHRQAPAGATGYIQDQLSMLQNVYQPAFWVARRR